MITDMNKPDRGEFERSWMKVFDEAEIRPSDQVWLQISATLANDEATGYKKRLLFFKLLAAASLVFAVGIGIYSGYLNLQNKTAETTIVDSEIIEEFQSDSPDVQNPLLADKKSDDEAFIPEITTDEASIPVLLSEENVNETALQLTEADEYEVIEEEALIMLSSIPWSPDYSEPSIRKYIRYMPDYFVDEVDIKVDKEPAFWAGINFSAGVFNPNVQYGSGGRGFSPLSFLGGQADAAPGASPSSIDQSDGTIATLAENRSSNYAVVGYDENDFEADQALAYSVNLGYRLGQRWVIESGLGYRYDKASTITNSYFSDPVSNNRIPNMYVLEYEKQDLNQVNYLSESYKVYNTFEFITIPVDVGYLMIDGKFNLLLKTGVSTNIFLQNTIENQDVGFDKIQLDNNEETPFRNVYLNGKFSTQLSYMIFERYHVSLEPSYRFALNSMTEDNSRITSYPSSFMISTGFWYSF